MATSTPSRKKLTVAEFISAQIDLCDKSQKQIAMEAGFQKPNMITMIKQGLTKLPMARVAGLAESLGVDKLHLYRMAMEEYEPGVWDSLQASILKQPIITANEMEIITMLREMNISDLQSDSVKNVEILKSALAKAKE